MGAAPILRAGGQQRAPRKKARRGFASNAPRTDGRLFFAAVTGTRTEAPLQATGGRKLGHVSIQVFPNIR